MTLACFFSCTTIWMICFSEVLLRLPYCTDLSIPMDDRLLVRWWMMVTVLPFAMISPPFRHASIGIQDWQCVKIRNVGTCAGTLHRVFTSQEVFFLGGEGGSSTDISNCQRLVGMAQDWSPMPGSLLSFWFGCDFPWPRQCGKCDQLRLRSLPLLWHLLPVHALHVCFFTARSSFFGDY